MIDTQPSETRTPMRRKIRPLEEEERRKHQRLLGEYVGKGGMWPLNAPGMPPPGPDFLRVAQALGDDTIFEKGTKKKEGVYTPGERLRELYRRALREPGFPLDVQVRAGTYATVSFVPGHLWGQHAAAWKKSITDINYTPPPVDGPQPADVFVLGKMPWKEETELGRNLVSATGEILKDLCDRLHVKDAANWYVTNLVKFMPPTVGSTRLAAGWIKDCLPLLHQELRIVRPRYILCLGADASKTLLGERYNVGYMAGRVVPYTYDVRLTADDEPKTHTAYVMTVLHPAEVSREPPKARILESNFGRFTFLIKGNNFDVAETDIDHRACYFLEDAEEWVQEANLELADVAFKDRLIGVDLEWQGQHPVNKGTYVRTIQLSWANKKAICFVLKHPGGGTAFRDRDGKPAIKRLVRLLNGFMEDKRACGHFLVSDLEWADSIGFYPTAGCPVPLYPENGKLAWERMRDGEGWLDSAAIDHAIEETAPLGLEMLSMRYTTAPRYDIPLEDWKKEECKRLKLVSEALEGYGNCPDNVLVPYGNYDADVTRRIVVQLMKLLDHDYEGNCSWEPCWETMIVQKPILRIHKNGILVDRALADEHTKKFITARAAMEEQIRTWAKWPEFNVRSVQQVREFLFGEDLSGKRDQFGHTVRLRPPGGKSLYVHPLLDTSKPPRRWSDLVEKGLDRDASPGTGKMILGILAEDNLNVSKQIGWVRDFRFLDQVLKSVLRYPKVDENDNWIENDEGFLEYDKGLVASIDDDGRVRTHIYPTAETGRWKHSRPNLANLSKSRDPDYARMLGAENVKGKWVGGLYTRKLRSLLKASPGYAFIEFDYMAAELYGMAVMSGSKLMQEHCLRALLEESDPNYYDIHSSVAVLAFRLDCPPTKTGLESIGKIHFRTLAKNVIFGIAYGRGAKAIALSAREQRIHVTPDDAQKVIDAIFAMYPELVPFFHEAESRALEEKWLRSCFGRGRRFPTVTDYKLEGEFERQAKNFGIQSMIASAVDRGLAFLDDAIDQQGLQDDIRLLLQMHDAGLVEAKFEAIPHAMDLIKWAMVDMVEIWPTNLAGEPRGDGPYHLGLEFAIEKQWSEKWTKEEAQKHGIPTTGLKYSLTPTPMVV